MNLLSGWSNKLCSCETAVGVSVMGAFRGRSLDFRGVGDLAVAGALDVPAAMDDGTVGLLFCASPSLSAAPRPLSFRCCQGCDGGQDRCDCSPDMLVSGIPSFRGGISGCSVVGLTVSVINGRFDDWRTGRKEEKGHLCARSHRAHCLVGGS